MTLNVLIILVIAMWTLVGLSFAAWGVTVVIVRLARFIARPWRNAQAVIRQAEDEFGQHADEAIAIAMAWSDEENEILLGRRPLQ